MSRRYYRRRNNNSAASVIRDTVYISNRSSWYVAAILGVILFAVFYWLLPAWMHPHLEQNLSNGPAGKLILVVFDKRIHWIENLGVVLGLVCAFFAVKNYFSQVQLGSKSERDVGFFSRLLARFFD